MGAAGDMLTAMLFELVPIEEREAVLAELNSMGIDGVTFTPVLSEKCGLKGTHMEVLVHGQEEQPGDAHLHLENDESAHLHLEEHECENDQHHVHESNHSNNHHHEHHSYAEVKSIIAGLKLSEEEKANVYNVYDVLAKAECQAHNVSEDELHFHEVGMKDAIADVAAVCHLIKYLGIENITATTLHTGYGKIHCAHGIMDVPTPATAAIIKELPHQSGDMEGELCTPTGAALIKYFVDEYIEMEEYHLLQNKVDFSKARFGHGMGKKDFPRPNAVRGVII